MSATIPELGKFNFEGGLRLTPEFVGMLVGLVIYTGAFIAEVVRAGILAVDRGQFEAARALGLTPMALGLGAGAELRTHLAITVIGGLAVDRADLVGLLGSGLALGVSEASQGGQDLNSDGDALDLPARGARARLGRRHGAASPVLRARPRAAVKAGDYAALHSAQRIRAQGQWDKSAGCFV